MRTVTSAFIASSMLFGAACGKEAPPAATPGEAPPAPAAPATPTAETPTPADPAAPNPATPEPTKPEPTAPTPTEPTDADPQPAAGAGEEAVKAFVQRWLDAQNGGDFDSYTALFAERFTGIKRAGERTRTFDRDRWLKDRKRMFKKQMKVDAADIRVTGGKGSAVVTFTQTWESGSFRDVGPKQLVVVGEGAAMRIAREEMLASVIEGTTDTAAALSPAQYLPVVSAPGFLGVATAPVGAERALGPVVSLQRGRSAFAPLAEQPASRPTLTLYGASGLVCEVTPTSRGVFADVIHHFGLIQIWDGTGDDGGERLSDEKVAAALLEPGDGRWDVWQVDPEACKGALWAREKADDKPAATVFAPVDAAPFADKAAEAFRALTLFKVVQREFDADETVEVAEGTTWDTWDATVTTRAFAGADGVHYVARAVSAGTGCGTFGASAWALWRVKGETWTLMSDGEAPSDAFTPEAAADLDGDGQPEFTDGATLVQPVGAVWKATRDVKPPYYDCPC
jgi:ketosteroid isomerase-like protein